MKIKGNMFYILIILLFGVILGGAYYKSASIEAMQTNNRISCFYAYYEKNDQYKNNFRYFLKHGLQNNIDYYIIINGASTVEIPELSNVQVFRRDNIGYDFGAYSYAVDRVTKEYDYYFFMNTSVKGPYYEGDWSVPFIELFDKDVSIVGTSINVLISENPDNLKNLYGSKECYPHVQSMFFCIHKYYFEYLRSLDFFNEQHCNSITDMVTLISEKEIGLSQLALSKGWNINAILSKYKGIDYRTITKSTLDPSGYQDPYFEGSYFGGSIDKNEVIFYKNTRFANEDHEI